MGKEDIEKLPRYRKCMHYVPGGFTELEKHYCAPNAKTLGEQWEQRQEINVKDCDKCDHYKCRYIEYPLTIQELEIKDPEAWGISFEPVKVRLCEDDKTYFGILLGEFPWKTRASFSEEDGKLKISTITNPCILLPEQKKIVFGCESWWSRIKPGEDISDITDEDIDNTWYVKLLRGLTKEEAQENETEERNNKDPLHIDGEADKSTQ